MLLLSTRLPATSQSSVLVMRERWAPGASTSAKSGFQAGITTTLQSSPATRPGPRHGAPPRLPLPPLRAPTPHSTLPPLRAPTPHPTLSPLRAPTPHSTRPTPPTPPPARPHFTIRHRSSPAPRYASPLDATPFRTPASRSPAVHDPTSLLPLPGPGGQYGVATNPASASVPGPSRGRGLPQGDRPC